MMSRLIRLLICVLFIQTPSIYVNAQYRIDANYDLTLFESRNVHLVPDYLLKYVRGDASISYPWLYSPACCITPKTDVLAPTCFFGRDGDQYYFMLRVEGKGTFPDVDISSSRELRIQYADSSTRILYLDSITPLVESFLYCIPVVEYEYIIYSYMPDEFVDVCTGYPDFRNMCQDYWLFAYNLDMVFRVDDINSFLGSTPVSLDFLGGQYVYDFSDNARFVKRLMRNLKANKLCMDKVYDKNLPLIRRVMNGKLE
jgi:hypothetical protein